MMIPSELLSHSLPELLQLVVAGKVATESIEWVKKRIEVLWGMKEYGFTPDPDLASNLKRISESEAYKRMKKCIGNHKYLGLVKLGLRIGELGDSGDTGRIYAIKNSVYDKYGIEGVRILDMGSTHILVDIIQHLSEIKIKLNHSQDYMVTFFELVINEWTEITIFHKTDDGQHTLKCRIVQKMEIPYPIFFVFASGQASLDAKRAIASLNNDKEIQDRKYSFTLHSKTEDRTGREYYTWIFKNLSSEPIYF